MTVETTEVADMNPHKPQFAGSKRKRSAAVVQPNNSLPLGTDHIEGPGAVCGSAKAKDWMNGGLQYCNLAHLHAPSSSTHHCYPPSPNDDPNQPPQWHNAHPHMFQGSCSTHTCQETGTHTYPDDRTGHTHCGLKRPACGECMWGEPCTECDIQEVCDAVVYCDKADCEAEACCSPDCPSPPSPVCTDEACSASQCMSIPCDGAACEKLSDHVPLGPTIPCDSETCQEWMQNNNQEIDFFAGQWQQQHGDELGNSQYNIELNGYFSGSHNYPDPGIGSAHYSNHTGLPFVDYTTHATPDLAAAAQLASMGYGDFSGHSMENCGLMPCTHTAHPGYALQSFALPGHLDVNFGANSTSYTPESQTFAQSSLSTSTSPDFWANTPSTQQPLTPHTPTTPFPKRKNEPSEVDVKTPNGRPASKEPSSEVLHKQKKAPKVSTKYICRWILSSQASDQKLCNREFGTAEELHQHLTTHSKDLSQPYECHWDGCDRCRGKPFPQRGKLNTHLQTHSNWSPFKCDYCEKTFKTKEQKINHETIHTGDKRFKCKYCGRLSSTSTQNLNHERTHSKEKPHKCKWCDYACSDSSNLSKHVRSRHPEELRMEKLNRGRLIHGRSMSATDVTSD